MTLALATWGLVLITRRAAQGQVAAMNKMTDKDSTQDVVPSASRSSEHL